MRPFPIASALETRPSWPQSTSTLEMRPERSQAAWDRSEYARVRVLMDARLAQAIGRARRKRGEIDR